MLYSTKELLSKDIVKSAMVLTVVQFHFRINAYWCMLQTIMDRTVDFDSVVELCWRLYIVYYILYSVLLNLCQKLPVEKETFVEAPTHYK